MGIATHTHARDMSTVTQNGKAIGEWDVPDSPMTAKAASSPFKKAAKNAIKLRMALYGPSGSGKTMTAMKFAKELGKRTAFMDGEESSALRYADLFDFDHADMQDFSVQSYIELIRSAEDAGYDTLIMDLSPAWNGKGGLLEQVDVIQRQNKYSNSFQAWGQIKPMEQALWNAILTSRCHIIACLRSKTEYVVEQNEKGKAAPRKIGTAPVQREGLEYEFDIVGELDVDNNIIFSKTRCVNLKGKLFNKPGKDVMDIVIPWLGSGAASNVAEASVSEAAETISYTPIEDEDYPSNEMDTIERILKGEEILKGRKVKGWLTNPQRDKSRTAYCPNGNFHDSSLGQLHHYLKHLRTTVASLPE
jgi:hypothetical protein